MNKPLISVIIPCHNNTETLEESVLSIVNQTYPNLEIIIVDDFSTDDSFKMAEELSRTHTNVHAYRLPNEDPLRFNKNGRNINAGYSARNFAFTKANGEWITFQDADDTCFRNRIEAQYDMAILYDSNHICLDWQQYKKGLCDNVFKTAPFLSNKPLEILNSKDIKKIASSTKGVAHKILGPLAKYIPFEIKTARIIHKFFFGSLDQYPGTGNSPLFKAKILDKVQFRQRDARVWPSFVGRGADRDFNFQVAETFGKSVTVYIPLYLWRQENQNEKYSDLERYIVE